MTLMDNETGEVLLQEAASCMNECSNLDMETGEVVGVESEGEVEEKMNHRSRSAVRKTKFNVPKSYLKQSEEDARNDESSRCYLSSHETFSLADKKRVIELKEVST
jgi:hypothetical protein